MDYYLTLGQAYKSPLLKPILRLWNQHINNILKGNQEPVESAAITWYLWKMTNFYVELYKEIRDFGGDRVEIVEDLGEEEEEDDDDDDDGIRVNLDSIKIEVVDNPEVEVDTETAEFQEEGRNEEHCQEINFPPRAIVHSHGCPLWRSGNLEGTVGGDLEKRKEFKGIGNVGGAEIGGEVRGNQLVRMGSFGGLPEVLEFAGNREGMEESWEGTGGSSEGNGEINHGETLDDEDGLLARLKYIKTEIMDNPEDSEGQTDGCQEGMNEEEEEEETFQGYQIVDVKVESPEDPEEGIMKTGGNPEEDPENGPNEVEMELEGMNDNDDEDDGGMQDLNGIGGEGGENLVDGGQDDLDGMPKLTPQVSLDDDETQQVHVHENNGPPPVLQKEASKWCWVCHQVFGNAGLLACHVKKRHPDKFVKKKVERKPKKQPKLDKKKKKNESSIPECTKFVMFKNSAGNSSKRNPVPTLKKEGFTTNGKIPCSLCNDPFGNRGALGMHMKHRHFEPKKPRKNLEATEGPSGKVKDTDKMGDFTCVGCLFKFKANSQAELIQHKKLSH